MTQIILLPGLIEDFERIRSHLQQHESAAAENRIVGIIKALDGLTDNPLLGRGRENGMRELVIGRDTRGYIALYRFVEKMDTVVVLAVRAQREAGYARNPEGSA